MSRRKVLALRESNGRIQREPQLPPPSEVRRLRDAALAGMRDPVWGTEIGRLYLLGKISSAMFAAGKQWGEYAAKYSQALCSPSPDPKAVNWDRMGGEAPDPDSFEGRKEARRHAKAVQSFIDASAALKTAGSRSECAVRTVCERNQVMFGHENQMALVVGLSTLSGFWGLTDSRKSVVR